MSGFGMRAICRAQSHAISDRTLTCICVLAPDELIGREGFFGEKGSSQFVKDLLPHGVDVKVNLAIGYSIHGWSWMGNMIS